MTNARTSERSKGKIARVTVGGLRLKLQLSDVDMKEFKKRKRVIRWFNDKPGRLDRALAGGYKFVDPKYATSLGQGALHRDGKDPESDTRVSLVVNNDVPVIRAYLMEISRKFFDEDQALKEKKNQAVDEALNVAVDASGASIENQYGGGVTYSH